MNVEAQDWCAVLLRDPCVYCGREADTIDHILCIKEGGTNDWANLAPSCRSCNSKKNTRPLLSWLLKRRGQLL